MSRNVSTVIAATLVAGMVAAGCDRSPGAFESIHAFTARGNEPFWRVQVEGGTLNYSTPELQPGKALQAQRAARATGVAFSGLDAGQPFTLSITDVPCQDSMSGESFEFTATFQHGDQSMTGCARRGP